MMKSITEAGRRKQEGKLAKLGLNKRTEQSETVKRVYETHETSETVCENRSALAERVKTGAGGGEPGMGGGGERGKGKRWLSNKRELQREHYTYTYVNTHTQTHTLQASTRGNTTTRQRGRREAAETNAPDRPAGVRSNEKNITSLSTTQDRARNQNCQ